MRLTAAFTVLVALVGAAIVVAVYLAMSVVPDYQFTASDGAPAIDPSTLDPSTLRSSGIASTSAPHPTDPMSATEALVKVTGRGDVLRLLLTTSLVVYVLVVIGGSVLSWLIAGRVLRPVEAITDAARRAATGRLDHRIALDGPPDEFRRLADTFDDMLERIDRSFEAQRRFAANASHELRTPLATTQALLDVALLDPDEFDREALAMKLRETNTRNIETVEALLALADAQSGTMVAETIDLQAVVAEVVATTAAAAAEKSIAVTTELAPTTTTGDPTLLRLLVVNLVTNAIRYNHVGGQVDISLGGDTLAVSNTGPVVPDEHLLRLAEPFFRAAGRVAGSHGLGLALVAAIVEGHAAELDLAARDGGGLTATVRLHP